MQLLAASCCFYNNLMCVQMNGQQAERRKKDNGENDKQDFIGLWQKNVVDLLL